MKRIELMTQVTSNKTNYNQHIKFNIGDIFLKVVNNKSKIYKATMFSALLVHGSHSHKMYKGFIHRNLIFDIGKKDI